MKNLSYSFNSLNKTWVNIVKNKIVDETDASVKIVASGDPLSGSIIINTQSDDVSMRVKDLLSRPAFRGFKLMTHA